IPRVPPKAAGYEFWGFYESAREVGGDYYGYIPVPDGRIVCAVGDVAGKGVSASLIMARLSSDIRYCALTEPDPARAMARLNDSLCEFTGPMDRFVTVAAVVLEPAAHTATMMTGGHGSPLLWRPARGEVVEAMPKDVGGPPLG